MDQPSSAPRRSPDCSVPYLLDSGDVWFTDAPIRPAAPGWQERHICGSGDLLGVAYDGQDGVLHKHGTAERVARWADATRAKFLAAAADSSDGGMFLAMAGALVVVSVPATPETVAMLNGMIACSGQVAELQHRLAGLGVIR